MTLENDEDTHSGVIFRAARFFCFGFGFGLAALAFFGGFTSLAVVSPAAAPP